MSDQQGDESSYPPPGWPSSPSPADPAPLPPYGAPLGTSPYEGTGQPSPSWSDFGYGGHGGYVPGGYDPRTGEWGTAEWVVRAGAYVIDALAITFVTVLAGAAAVVPAGLLLGDDAAAIVSVSVLLLAYVAAYLVDYCWLQGRHGWTIGKRIMGIRVVGLESRAPIGFWRSFVRQLAHALDGLSCYIGYLWPLWDDERRTFADMMCKTRVVKIRQRVGTAAVVTASVAAVVLFAGQAALGIVGALVDDTDGSSSSSSSAPASTPTDVASTSEDATRQDVLDALQAFYDDLGTDDPVASKHSLRTPAPWEASAVQEDYHDALADCDVNTFATQADLLVFLVGAGETTADFQDKHGEVPQLTDPSAVDVIDDEHALVRAGAYDDYFDQKDVAVTDPDLSLHKVGGTWLLDGAGTDAASMGLDHPASYYVR